MPMIAVASFTFSTEAFTWRQPLGLVGMAFEVHARLTKVS